MCLPTTFVSTLVFLFVTFLGSCSENLVSFQCRHGWYKAYSFVLNVGTVLGSSIEAVRLGTNGISNRTHGSEQEEGNLGDLHDEVLGALVEMIGKLDQIMRDGIGLDEIVIL